MEESVSSIDLSVVVPVFNEEENVAELCERIVAALRPRSTPFEVLLIDDGSRDRTLERMLDLRREHPELRVVKLRRNCGQTPAMRAGIDLARGRTIVTMDGDLQNDPADIPQLVDKLDEGYELVAGWRKNRQDKALTRKLPSKIANWIIHRVTAVPIRDNGCSLKAYRAEVIKRTPLYSELHRFIPAMMTVPGGRIAEVAVNHHPRTHGESKYGLSRVGKVILDIFTVKMLITFAQRPLHWFGLLAVPFILLSVLFFVLFLFTATTDLPDLGAAYPRTKGPVFAPVSILFFFLAINYLTFGLLGDLIVKTGERYEYRAKSRVFTS